MSNATIGARVDELTTEVRSLKNTVMRLSNLIEKEDGKPVKRLNINELDFSDPTPDDLMLYASNVFGVSSKPSPDDNNIADDAVVKSIDFSGYA